MDHPARLRPIGQPGFTIDPAEIELHKNGKSNLEKAALVLATLIALLSFVLQWKQNPWLSVLLGAVALLVAASVFGGPTFRYLRSARLQAKRNKFVRSELPAFDQLVRRFAKFVDAGDGNNLRNIVYYGCGTKSDPTEFDRLFPTDYLKEVFPLFFERFKKKSCKNEAEFRDALYEFYTLVASYNNSYVGEPLRRMTTRQWTPVDFANHLGLAPAPGPWLESHTQVNRINLEKQIEDFRERWVSYLDTLQPFLENIQHHLGPEVRTFLDRPKKL
jgi:hypothetical protein